MIKNKATLEKIVLFTIIALGAFLRIYNFPDIPPGLNSDEAIAGYEAYSLLKTGKSLWGYPWPAHFPDNFSGLNVAYSYLSIPFIAVFGFNIFSTRMLQLILGLATLPLFYILVRKIYGTPTALFSLLILALTPWHIMISRWGLESNILPFFMLLGALTVHHALQKTTSFKFRLIALIPWAIALYTYSTAFLLIPLFMMFIFISYANIIWRNRFQWLLSLLIFSLVSLPIFTFILTNTLAKSSPVVNEISQLLEKYSVASIPHLPITRWDQVRPASWLDNHASKNILKDNLHFARQFLKDGLMWNETGIYPPLLLMTFPFFFIGIFCGIMQLVKKKEGNIFLFWLAASLALFPLLGLNITRANSLFLPFIAFVGLGLAFIIEFSKKIRFKAVIATIFCFIIFTEGTVFAIDYFVYYPPRAAPYFQFGLEKALISAEKNALPEEKIFVSPSLWLGFIYVLFYLKIDPREFQMADDYEFMKKTLIVNNFGRFFFNQEALQKANVKNYVFVTHPWESPFCYRPSLIWQKNNWIVGRCVN